MSDYQYGWNDQVTTIKELHGINEDTVRQLSAIKEEPEWMLEYRLKALNIFNKKPMPTWGADLSHIDFDDFTYYLDSSGHLADSWEEVPEEIKNTYNKLGIPQAEQDRLISGVMAQYESEAVYEQVNKELDKLGVIFTDTDTALRKYPELFKKYFSSVIPAGDNKFSALNSIFWSGGSFLYVPPNTHVELPLQAYFRINSQAMGQFERTLIIVDEGSSIEYIEGCSSPTYSTAALHSAVVEIIVKPNSECKYITIQNWSDNVYNLVTKRAKCETNSTMQWIDANIGSKITMKYPAVWLMGKYAKGEVLSLASANKPGQHQDTGAKIIHAAPNTKSNIISKSVSSNQGRTSYRGLVQVNNKAYNSHSTIQCDALLIDEMSQTDTYPYMDLRNDDITIEHEATVSKISEAQLFYLMSRGMNEQTAKSIIINGFIDPISNEFPMEYALELRRLMEINMENSVG